MAEHAFDTDVRSGHRARLRLTGRGRVILTVAVLALLTGAALAHRGGGAVSTSHPVGRVEQVVVEPGDTLWGVAVRVAPADDPRRTVARLVRANRLSTATLRPGQVLTVRH